MMQEGHSKTQVRKLFTPRVIYNSFIINVRWQKSYRVRVRLLHWKEVLWAPIHKSYFTKGLSSKSFTPKGIADTDWKQFSE